jgi:tRNA-binding protein
VAHSEKLVRLRVDFGDHARSILVGMKKERPSPKEIEGRQALFLSKPLNVFGALQLNPYPRS